MFISIEKKLEHIRKLENQENFQELIFQVIKFIYLFEHFSKHFRCSRQNSQGVAQSYQGALTNEA